MAFVKQNVSYKEFMMHEHIYNLSKGITGGVLNVPKIINYDVDKQILTMEKIDHMCVSDFYGENEKHISKDLFRTVRSIIRLSMTTILYILTLLATISSNVKANCGLLISNTAILNRPKKMRL